MLCDEIEEDESFVREEIYDLPNILEFDESEASIDPIFDKPQSDENNLNDTQLSDKIQKISPFQKYHGRFKISKLDAAIIDKLWEAGEMGVKNPRAILLGIWYILTKEFGIKSRVEHCRLKLKNFTVHTNESGMRYLIFHSKANQQSQQLCELLHQKERCPVQIFEHYITKRPIASRDKNSHLYLKPNRDWNQFEDGIWFTDIPLGKNKVGGMMNSALRRINSSYNGDDNDAFWGAQTNWKLFARCDTNKINSPLTQAAKKLSNRASQLRNKKTGRNLRFHFRKNLQIKKSLNHNDYDKEPHESHDGNVTSSCTLLMAATPVIATSSQPIQSPSTVTSPFRKILPRALCYGQSQHNSSANVTNNDNVSINQFASKSVSLLGSSLITPSSVYKTNFQLPKTSHASSKVTTLLANALKAKQDVVNKRSSSSESSYNSPISSPPIKRKYSDEETPKHSYNTRSSSKKFDPNDKSCRRNSSSQPKDHVVNLIDDDDDDVLPKIQKVESMSPLKQGVPQTIDVASISQAILSSINNGVLKFVSTSGSANQSQIPITLKVVVQPNGTLVDQNCAIHLQNSSANQGVTISANSAQNEHIDLTVDESVRPLSTSSQSNTISVTQATPVSSAIQTLSCVDNGYPITETQITRVVDLTQATDSSHRITNDELKEIIDLLSEREKVTIPEYIYVRLVSDVLWQTGALSMKGPWFVIFSLWWMTHYYFGIIDPENQEKLQWGHFKLIKTRDDELTSASTCLTYVGPTSYVTSKDENVCKFIYPDSARNYIDEGADFIKIYEHYRDKRPPDSFSDDSPFYLQSCVKGPKEVVASHHIWYENAPLSQTKIGALMRNMVQKIVRPNMHVVKDLSRHFPNVLIPTVKLLDSAVTSPALINCQPQPPGAQPTQLTSPVSVQPPQQLPPVNIVSLPSFLTDSNLTQAINSTVQLPSLNGISPSSSSTTTTAQVLSQNLLVNSSSLPVLSINKQNGVPLSTVISNSIPVTSISSCPQIATTTPTVAAQPAIMSSVHNSFQNIPTVIPQQSVPTPRIIQSEQQIAQPLTAGAANPHLNEFVSQLMNNRIAPQNDQTKVTMNPPIQIIQKQGETPSQTMQSLMIAVQQHAAQNNKVVQLFQLPPGTKLINPISSNSTLGQNGLNLNLVSASTINPIQENGAGAGPAIANVVSLQNAKVVSDYDTSSLPNGQKYIADIEPPEPCKYQLKTLNQVIEESLNCQDEKFLQYVERLWYYKLLGCDNPWSLNFTLWFINVMVFGIESRAEHLRLALGDFKLSCLPDGRNYIYYYQKSTQRSIYLLESPPEEPKFKCPFYLFNLHRKVRPPATMKNSDRFYLQPRLVNSKLANVWYTEIGWGKNKLGSLMQDAANLAKLPNAWLKKSRLKNSYYVPNASKTSDALSLPFDTQSVVSGPDPDNDRNSSVSDANSSFNRRRSTAPLNVSTIHKEHEVVCISDDEEEDIKPVINDDSNHPPDSNSVTANSQDEYENSASPTNSETDSSRKRKNYKPMRFGN